MTTRELFARLGATVSKSSLDSDLDAELKFHLEMATEENIRAGMSPEDARRQARIKLGGMEQLKEEHRDARGLVWLESLFRDIQLAFRSVRKHAGFAATVLVTLALGIGVTAAVFSIINAFWLHPLPYENLDRLAWMQNTHVQTDQSNVPIKGMTVGLSPAEYYDWKDRAEIFEEVIGFNHFTRRIPESENPVGVFGWMVSANLFSALGVEPFIGRTFVPEDESSEADRAVILQYDFWQRHFGGDPEVLGKSIPFGPYQPSAPGFIVGVMKPDFVLFARHADLFVPFRWGENAATPSKTTRQYRGLRAIGLLKSGLSLHQAQAQADSFSKYLADQYPETNRNWKLDLVSLKEETVREVKPAALALLSAVGFVLLITCTNVASLHLVRGTARAKELAIRKALGAGRWRLIRQLLCESLMLSSIGALLALPLAWGMVEYFRTQLPSRSGWAQHLVQVEAIRIDGWVVIFVIMGVFMTGLLFSLFPARRVSKPDLAESLKDLGASSLGGHGNRKIRNALVVAEVSLAVVLVVGAVLLARTFVALYDQGPGFRAEGLFAIGVWNSMDYIHEVQSRTEERSGDRGGVSRTVAAGQAFRQDVLEEVSSVPGVESVTWAWAHPMKGSYYMGDYSLSEEEGATQKAIHGIVEENYFQVMGMPVLQGRTFDSQDQEGTRPVVVVSEEASRRFWPGQDPLGKQVRNTEWREDWMTIVGVVGDVRDDGMDKAPQPRVYQPASQKPRIKGDLIVRSSVGIESVMPVIRERIRSIDSACFIRGPWSISQVVRDSVWRVHYSMLLIGGLAGLSLILALVGVYGVLSWTVRERLREIGLRMALGADWAQILWLVVRQGVVIALLGIALGLTLATVLTRYLQSLLFGVEPIDWTTFALVSLCVLVTALVASYIPASRATKVDPMVALRYE